MLKKYIFRIKNKEKLLEVLFLPVLWGLYFISGLFKRDQRVKLYGSPGNRFSDNAKYAFLEASSSNTGSDIICWVTADKELLKTLKSQSFSAVYRWSLKGLFLGFRAGEYHFSSYCSDVNVWTSKGAVLINYWHGVPFKKIEYDIHNGPLKTRFNPTTLSEYVISFIWYLCSPAPTIKPTFLYSPHSYFDSYFMSAFRVPANSLIRKQYPRVSYLKGKAVSITDASSDEQTKQNKTEYNECVKALYVPTFRDANRHWVSENILAYKSLLQETLIKKNIKLYIKPHPNERLRLSYVSDNIEVVDSQVDTYSFMRDFDFIITDYSSIAVDAAEAGLDVFLLWPDLLKYKSESRDLYFDIQEFYENKYFPTVVSMLNALSEDTFQTMNVKEDILMKHGSIQ